MIPADLLDQLRESDPELWEKFDETELAEYEVENEYCHPSTFYISRPCYCVGTRIPADKVCELTRLIGEACLEIGGGE